MSKRLYESNLIPELTDNIFQTIMGNGLVVEDSEAGKDYYQTTFEDLFNMPERVKTGMEDNDEDGEMDLKDTFTTKHFTRAFGEAVSRIIEFAVEPELVVTSNLFTPVQVDTKTRNIEIGAVGAISAEVIPEGQRYPEVQFNFGDGDMINVNMAKHGLKVSVTDAVIDENMFDVFGMFLKLSGSALGRHKEEFVTSLLNSTGITLFDNTEAGTSIYGSTTGRDIDGSFNGTIDVNNVMKMMAFMQQLGFNADTSVMNPLAWQMFMTDPAARETFLAGNVVREVNPSGDLNRRYNLRHGNMGYWENGTGNGFFQTNGRDGGLKMVPGSNPFTHKQNPLGATYKIQPKGAGPMTVLVSPYIPFLQGTASGKDLMVSDFMVCDSGKTGVLFEAGGVNIEDWKDPETDIKSMKINERWGADVLAQGKAIGVARNIALDKNYSFTNTNSVQLPTEDQTTSRVTL